MGKLYCSSDWHGCGTIAKKVMEYLGPHDRLYFLGDAIDRGPDGIKILQMLMRDPRVVFIRGNHEEMMRKRYRHLETFDERHMWDYNGNLHTERAFDALSSSEKKELLDFLDDETFIRWTVKTKDHTFHMTHSGYVSDFAMCSGNIFWDRDHIVDNVWPLERDRDIILHGHTPVQYMKFNYEYTGKNHEKEDKDMIELSRQWNENGVIDWKPEVLCYCYGHKYDLDMGTIASKRIALLDLNTLEAIYFDEEEE